MLRVAGRKSSNAVLRRSSHDIHRLRQSRGNNSLTSLAGLNESCRATPDNQLLTTQSLHQSRQNSWTTPMPTKSDFATNLIPLHSNPFSSLHGINTIISTKRIGIRHLTTNNNNNNKDSGNNASSSAKPKEVHSSSIGKVIAEEAASTANGASQEATTKGGMRNLAGSVRQRVNDRLNVGDKLSVYGIVGLIGLVLVSPFVVRYVSIRFSVLGDLQLDLTIS